jgi:hypothetical protein
MKKLLFMLPLVLLVTSCGKKTCVCEEKEYYHEKDISNHTVGSDSERAKYEYTVGQKAMNPDGTMVTYTKEYIEQQKSDLEATGKFDCEWK